jgi:hypothetical protein
VKSSITIGGPDGTVITHPHISGLIGLDPPGIDLSVEEIYRG